MKKIYLFIVIIILCLTACPSEYAPECGTECGSKKGTSSSQQEIPLTVTDLLLDSINYALYAKVNVKDGTEVNVTCNGKAQTAKAGGGEIWWDMSSSFHKGIKGGKKYSVEFSANGGYSGKVTSQIDYWPKAEYTLLSPNSVTIYNGSAKTYQPPKYTMNYDVNQVTLKMTFKAFNTDGTEENIDTSAWQLAQMLDFLSKVENDGKRVEVHFSVTPKCNKGELVAAKGCMTYFCKADILIDKVEIRQEYDYYKAFLTDANGNEAGGKIVYKWEKSANGSSWTKISDVTTDIYKPKNEDLGNKLRVTITQTYGLESQTITKTSQSVDLLNIISETNLYYDGVVLTGTKIDFTKIKGVIKNLSGNEVNIADVSFNLVSQESLYTSQYVDLIIKKSLYSDKQISVYVPVQHSFSESELPKLSEKVRNITIGHAAFAETDDDYSKLEFSLDNGVSWTILSTEEFAVKANDTILIRVKRIGTPNTIGYIMESKPLAITVKNQNIGLKDPAPFTITVSDVTLDTNAILTAKTNLPNGTSVTVLCNDVTFDNSVFDKNITINMQPAFRNVLGGSSCNVTFRSEGCDDASVNVTYWPKVTFSLLSPNVITIYNGSTQNYQLPNYNINYVKDKVNTQITYKQYNADDTIGNAAISNFDQMLTFLSASEHNGCRVEVHFLITPKFNGGDKLAAGGYVSYYCRSEVIVDKVEIRQSYDGYKAFLTDASGDEAGGNIVYKWEKSVNNSPWTELKDVTGDIYTPKSSDLGSKLRVTVTQTYEGGAKTINRTSEPVYLKNVISEVNLYYEGTVLTGTSVDFSKIKGVIKNVAGDELNVADVTFDFVDGLTEHNYILSASQSIYVTIKESGYEDKTVPVFVTVQSVLLDKDMPKLSEDGRSITVGNVVFVGDTSVGFYADLEFSSNMGVSYDSIPNGEFQAIPGDKLLIRRKKVGTPNTNGYIKESEPLVIIVTNQNVGLKSPASFAIEVSNVEFDSIPCILTADTNLPNGTDVTVDCNGVQFGTSVIDGKIITGMEPSFHEKILGGYSYIVTFSAEDCIGTSASIEYWPMVKYGLTVSRNVTVYNGGANYFVIPELTTNYGDNLNETMTFTLFDTTTDKRGNFIVGNEIDGIDTSNWTVVDMMMFIADVKNHGKSIQVHFDLVPKCVDGEELAGSGEVAFHCRRDIQATSVTISRNKENREIYEAHPHSSDSDVSDDDTAGGIIEYQWQRAHSATASEEQWQNISGATKKTYKLRKGEYDNDHFKYLRVRIKQTWEGIEQSPIYSAPSNEIKDFIIKNNLYYNNVLPIGSMAGRATPAVLMTPSLAPNGRPAGNVESYFAGIRDAGVGIVLTPDYNFGTDYYYPTSSRYLMYKHAATTLEETHVPVFVPVRYVFDDSEVPQLSTEVSDISAGKVKFTSLNYNLEYSTDGGKTYLPFPDGEFTAKAGDVLTLRKSSLGTPNTEGYIKESNTKTVMVKEENIGKKAVGGGIIDNVTIPTLTLTKTSANGMTYVVPHLSIAGSGYIYEYTWLIDGSDALDWNGVTTNYKNELIIRESEFAADVYQIVCKVTLYLGAGGQRYEVVTVSEQSSLVISN